MRSGTGDVALTEVLKITHEGNIGIGTTTPGGQLAVENIGTGFRICSF